MKYRITALSPLIMRDARPFGEGSRMHSLSWLTQTATAGAIRSTLWKMSPDNTETLTALRHVQVSGAFPVFREKMYFPRPLDVVKSGKNVYRIRPLDAFPEGSGANMPISGLLPCVPETEEDFKPDKLNAFWSRELMAKWLNNDEEEFTIPDSETLDSPARDERTHASINPKTGTSGTYAGEGRLFSTTGLDFMSKEGGFSRLQASIDAGSSERLPALPDKFIAPLGGERRLAEFTSSPEDESLWACPSELAAKYGQDSNVRLVLATPAIFAQGWFPGWLSVETLTGEFPGTRAVVQLVSAVVDRWQPVAGWSYERGSTGHKPMRRAVPAGSVYFFRVLEGSINAADLWLKSVCDDGKDIADGFGLGLLGKW